MQKTEIRSNSWEVTSLGLFPLKVLILSPSPRRMQPRVPSPGIPTLLHIIAVPFSIVSSSKRPQSFHRRRGRLSIRSRPSHRAFQKAQKALQRLKEHNLPFLGPIFRVHTLLALSISPVTTVCALHAMWQQL